MAVPTAFGITLKMDDGDLVLTGSPALAPVVISGVPGALQSLVLKVLTPFGTDPFNVTYGFDVRPVFVEPNDPRAVRQLVRMSLVQSLGTDPRVRDVREILFKDDPEYRERHPELSDADIAALIRGERERRTRTVDVVLDLVDAPGQSLAVNIGV
jgi:hypothetical protein